MAKTICTTPARGSTVVVVAIVVVVVVVVVVDVVVELVIVVSGGCVVVVSAEDEQADYGASPRPARLAHQLQPGVHGSQVDLGERA